MSPRGKKEGTEQRHTDNFKAFAGNTIFVDEEPLGCGAYTLHE